MGVQGSGFRVSGFVILFGILGVLTGVGSGFRVECRSLNTLGSKSFQGSLLNYGTS